MSPATKAKIDEEKNKLLDIYFKYFNTMFLYPLTRSDLEDQTDKGKQLQYYTALSFASRSTRNKQQTIIFENTARKISKDIFDTFSESSALGFAMLTCYYWGQDQGRSIFYFSITKAICKQIGPKLDPAKIILIESMASCCCVIYEPYIDDLLKRMMAAYDASTVDLYKRQLRVAIILVEIKFDLIRAYPLEDGEKYMSTLIDFNRLHQCMSPQVSSTLLSKLDFVERIMNSEHNKSLFQPVWPLLSAFFDYFRSMLHFVNGEFELGVQVANQIVENCYRNSSIMCYSPPALVLCNHFCFCVAYKLGNISIAVKASGILRSLSYVLPVAEMALVSDSRRLRQLISAQESIPKLLHTDHNDMSTHLHPSSNYLPFSHIQELDSQNSFNNDNSFMKLFGENEDNNNNNNNLTDIFNLNNYHQPPKQSSSLSPDSLRSINGDDCLDDNEKITEVDELFGTTENLDFGKLINTPQETV